MSGYRAMGPRNAVLPAATATVVGFMRNPDRFPYQRYVQFVPLDTATEGLYRFPTIEPDEPARLVSYAEFAWGWDDARPEGEGFQPRVTWTAGETKRFAFGYKLGERTNGAWSRNTKIKPEGLYSRMRLGHAMLHRASRAVDAVRGFAWPAYNTATLQALLGTPATPVYIDLSSGTELMPASGNQNPNFQVIKKLQNVVMRRLDLLTNGALTGNEFCMVVGPRVAQNMAISGEIVHYLAKSPFADKLMERNKKWGVPDEYNGWQIVVEDTPRVFVRPNDSGTFANPATALGSLPVGFVTQPNQKDYIWNDDSIMFCSRAGGLDGQYGEDNFSTVQMYHYNGIARVKADTDNWNEIVRGSIDIEDDFKVAAPLSGFLLTGTLSAAAPF